MWHALYTLCAEALCRCRSQMLNVLISIMTLTGTLSIGLNSQFYIYKVTLFAHFIVKNEM